jgi:hypothetical protein
MAQLTQLWLGALPSPPKHTHQQRTTITHHTPPPQHTHTERSALVELRSFNPDVIIAIGGGSPMDAAKLMWLMYEVPDIKFEEVAARFMVRDACAGRARGAGWHQHERVWCRGRCAECGVVAARSSAAVGRASGSAFGQRCMPLPATRAA